MFVWSNPEIKLKYSYYLIVFVDFHIEGNDNELYLWNKDEWEETMTILPPLQHSFPEEF
jgi:hypothetical protein